MPTINSPLIGLDVHGQLGHAVIYQGRNVRSYFVPANPRSTAQQNNRTLFKLAKGAIRILQPETRAAIRAAAPDPEHWSAWLIGLILGSSHTTIDATIADFNALDEADQLAWSDFAGLAELPAEISAPGDATPIDRGIVLFALAWAIHPLSIDGAPTAAPSVETLNDWSLFLADVAPTTPNTALLFEDGSFRITEDGDYLIQES